MTDEELELAERELAELDAESENLKSQSDRDRKVRSVADKRALVDLQKQHGPDNVIALDVGDISDDSYTTMVIYRRPTRVEMKRFRDGIKKNSDEAGRKVMTACLSYPARELYEAMDERQDLVEVQHGKQFFEFVGRVELAEKKGSKTEQ